jgi:hypothetical protein
VFKLFLYSDQNAIRHFYKMIVPETVLSRRRRDRDRRSHRAADRHREEVRRAEARGVSRHRRAQLHEPGELAELGIAVHLIKGYGDTAVAECAIALMWEGARGLAKMDRGCAPATGCATTACS